MSEAKETSQKIKTATEVSFRLFPGFLTMLLVLCALTGNCSCLGFDRDYVQQWSGGK